MPKELDNNSSKDYEKKFELDVKESYLLKFDNQVDLKSRKISSFSNASLKNDENLEQGKLIVMSKEKKKFFKKVWILMVIFLSILLTQYFVFGTIDFLAMNREENVVKVEIPKNSGKSDIAKILYDNGVIKNRSFFNFYTTLTKSGKKFIPGTFEIKTNLDYEAIVNFLNLNSNRVETDIINVVIPEGKNVLEVASILESNGICDQKDFIEVCKQDDFGKNYEFLKSFKNMDKVVYKVEGYLFPDTYKLYKDSDPKLAIKKMLSNYKSKLNSKDYIVSEKEKLSIKEYAEKIGLSEEDLVNIASLIQAEAADEKDMYNVSSVIFNRLGTLKNANKSKFGEPGLNFLGIDSTVWYPYKTRDKVPKDLLENFVGAYDTYKNPALPIGPICNPGVAAIDAALKPNKTDYYYFCHDKSGQAYYAKNSKEHQENLKKAGLV